MWVPCRSRKCYCKNLINNRNHDADFRFSRNFLFLVQLLWAECPIRASSGHPWKKLTVSFWKTKCPWKNCMRSSNPKTSLRLRGRNAALMLRKRKGSYDSCRKYKNEWEITFVGVQKAPYGSVIKLWHHWNQSVQYDKPWIFREASEMSSSTSPSNS